MRVLLDECLPVPLADEFSDSHRVATVPGRDWAGLPDDELLEKAEGAFDFFVTVDAGIEYERELARFALGIVLLSTPSNRLSDLVEFVPTVERELTDANRDQLVHLDHAS